MQQAGAGIILFLGPKQEIKYGNREFFRAFGANADELCGRQFHDLVVSHQREPLTRHLTELFNGTADQFSGRIAVPRRDALPLTGVLTAWVLRGSLPHGAAAVLSVRTVGKGGAGGIDDVRSLSKVDGKILEGIAVGLTSEVLASRLFISRQTVEYRIGRLLRKLSVSNRVALVARAYAVGVLRVDVWPPRVNDDATI
ncbi:LuxR C-terminal-related transcriptional regulator [Streptomyces sp. Ag109_O5-1]|uniref:helix-turn-helix transcriptional regulator n=1 Tax=Streptomyces sp. Ag109_O5-1 TaxID=1938851 RepID=UPI0016255203|nr:LuxR C-terminal-related transcriptional regulator [Streptomyces sp. Ag109_O5-1]